MTPAQILSAIARGESDAHIIASAGASVPPIMLSLQDLAAYRAVQPIALHPVPPVQAAPQVQNNYVAQGAPMAAVHTVQMPFPIDTQGVRFIPSLPTWTVWTLSILGLLMIGFLLVITSIWSLKPVTTSQKLQTVSVQSPQVTMADVENARLKAELAAANQLTACLSQPGLCAVKK